MSATKKVFLYAFTDGACKNNNLAASKGGRKAGSGIFIVDQNQQDVLRDIVERRCTSVSNADMRTMLMADESTVCRAVCPPLTSEFPTPSNNRAELYAFNSVLAHVIARQHTSAVHLCIGVDSKYVMTVYQNARTWQNDGFILQSSRSVAANLDYVKEMLMYLDVLESSQFDITVKHVGAHQTEDKDAPFEIWFDWFGNDMADRLSNVATGVTSNINYASLPKKSRKRKKSSPDGPAKKQA